MDTRLTANLQNTAQKGAGKGKTYDMAYIAVFTVLMAVCSWISIPTAIPFTLQTFAVFLAVAVLGGKRGTLAVTLYLLLGAVGVPVFAGFSGGLGIIMGNTGGYLIGFILAALLMWLMESIFIKKLQIHNRYIVLGVSMLLGMAVYYTAGTVWFLFVYMRNTGSIGLATVLSWCVIPFIIPDLIKAFLALTLSNTLRRPLSKIMGENE